MRVVVAWLVTLSLVVSSPAVHAQVLDDQWFKLVLSTRGSGVDSESGLVHKGKLAPLVRYARFVLDGVAPTPNYVLQIYAPTESGGWVLENLGLLTMLDVEETYVSDATITTSVAPVADSAVESDVVQLRFNATVKVALDGDELKSAKIRSVGALSYFTDGTRTFYGKARLRMVRVPVGKLPFEPTAVPTDEPVGG